MCLEAGGSSPELLSASSLLLSPLLSSSLSDGQAGPVASWQACPGSCFFKARPSALQRIN